MTGTIITSGIYSTVTLSSAAGYFDTVSVSLGINVSISSGYAMSSPLNIATIINDGSISAASNIGIYLYTTSTVINLANAVIYGQEGGIYTDFGNSTVNNYGSIISGAGLNANHIIGQSAGVSIFQGTVNNHLGALISGSQFGVYGTALPLTVSNQGTIQATAANGIGVSLDSGGLVVNDGLISGSLGAVSFSSTYSGTLVVEAGATFVGAVTATQSFTTTLSAIVINDNVLELAAGGTGDTLDMGASFSGFQNVTIDSGASWTLDGSGGLSNELGQAPTITGFTSADTLDITNFSASSHSYNAGILTLTGAAGSETFTFAGQPAVWNSADFTVTSANAGLGSEITLCFYPGTRIATPEGEAAVEDLAAGDLVLTANGAMAVRWIGRSAVAKYFADELRTLPIRITAGALGDGLPRRDLLVSPDHALFLDGLLVHAGALVNGSSILRERDVPDHFTYYHIELASHELLLAEGLLAESFVDNADALVFQNGHERPAAAGRIEELPYARAKSARQLPEALRARLAGAKAA